MRVLFVLLLIGACGWLYVRAQDQGAPSDTPSDTPNRAPGEGRPPVAHTGTYLDDGQRRTLFDLERADLLLGRALGVIKTAIKDGDRKGFLAQLQPGARLALPTREATEALPPRGTPYGYADLTRMEPRNPEAAWTWFSALRGRFSKLEVVKFARKRNGAEILAARDVVAESAGVFRIAGTTDESGRLELAGRFTLKHAGLADYDGEAPLTHWIHGLTLTDVRAVHTSQSMFREITEHTGIDVDALHDKWEHLDDVGHVSYGGVQLGDVNEDDALDLIVTERGNRSWLYLGTGTGRFTDSGWNPKHPDDGLVHVALFDATGDGRINVLHAGTLYSWDFERASMVPVKGATRLPNADASLCDYDLDGKTDVLFMDAGPRSRVARSSAYFDNERVTGNENALWQGLGEGRFRNVTKAARASGGSGRTFSATWFYANDDKWPDVFCANEFGRNAFLVNRGDGTFEDRPEIDPEFGGFSMGVSAGDFNGDGTQDLYVSNMYSKAGHRVYHHLDMALYPESVRQMFTASIVGNRIYESDGALGFTERSQDAGVAAVGWGWSGAAADFDLDGWIDLYAPCGHTSVDRDKPDG